MTREKCFHLRPGGFGHVKNTVTVMYGTQATKIMCYRIRMDGIVVYIVTNGLEKMLLP